MGLPQKVVDRFNETSGFDLREALVYAAYAGSASHNTHTPSSDPSSIDDVDITAVVIPPRQKVYGLHRFERPRQIQIDEWDVTVHPLTAFVSLCLKGNPNIICSLWVRPSEVLKIESPFRHFVQDPGMFSSKRIVTAFMGYAGGQMKKMTSSQAYEGYMGAKRKALVDKFGYDCKNAAHLIRLLRMCVEYTRYGHLQVWRTGDAELIRSIKRGEHSSRIVELWAEELFTEIRAALPASPLPEEPNEAKAEKMMLRAMHEHWRWQEP